MGFYLLYPLKKSNCEFRELTSFHASILEITVLTETLKMCIRPID